MSDATQRLGLATLPPTPVAPHVTHNEALVRLDALVFLRLLDRDLSAPPASPDEGDAYLVKAAGTGLWADMDGLVALWLGGAWRYCTPFAGLSAYVADEHKLIFHDGSGWGEFAAVVPLQNLPLLGVNTSADATNKLAVKSAALLFDNIGGGVQAKLNKHAAGDTASVLYQTNYSGRAEVGLTGDDNFHFKVSADGSTFVTAMTIDTAGRVLLDGQTAAYAVSNNGAFVTPSLQLAGLGTDAAILFGRFFAGSGSARFSFAKSRGATRGDFTAVSSGDVLGQFSFNGADGAAFQEAAWIRALAEGTPATGSVAGKIALGTTPAGANVPTDWFTIHQDGGIFVGSGSSTVPACKLDVDGPVRVKSYAVASLPDASAAGQLIFVSNESGGAAIAFSDGSNWRRVTDRAVVS